MIFYFTGTGNSLHAAKTIAAAQGGQLLNIAEEFDKKDTELEYKFADNELLGVVYPVYAWGPPKIVLDFIGRLRVTGSKPYVFSLCTCGGQEGNTTHILQKALGKKELALDSAFSVRMPSNYVAGYDMEPEEEAEEKLQKAEKTLSEINEVLTARKTGVFRLRTGDKAALRSTLINPLFNRFARSTKKFYATDACTQCGLCERICPVHTIKVEERPTWGKTCTQCMACINRCPAQAIQYGVNTVHRGRYVHPDLGGPAKKTTGIGK
jgi:ferredoxin